MWMLDPWWIKLL